MTYRLVSLLCLALCLSLWIRPAAAEAEIVQLSRSSSARDPYLVSDADGVLHAFWRTEQQGFLYSRSNGDAGWTTPIVVDLPAITQERAPDTFELLDTIYHTPRFIASGTTMHIFWLDEEQTLYHSQIAQGDIATWRTTTFEVVVARDVHTFDAQLNSASELIVAYTTADSAAPGFYTIRRLSTNRQFWETPVRHYASDYYRAVDSAEMNVMLAYDAAANRAAAVWNDPQREQLFYVDSADGGITWNEIRTVDSRQVGDALDSPPPNGLTITQAGNDIHLVWHAGHATLDCNLYHQYSPNGGASWRRAKIDTGFTRCPDEKELLLASDGTLWLFAAWQDNMHQITWRNGRWSSVKPFAELDQFTDPERIRPVRLRCRQSFVFENMLTTIGCDEQPGEQAPVYQDVWLVRRPLESLEFAFREAVWSDPLAVSQTIADIEAIHLLPDGERVHAYWAESAGPIASEHIHYALFNGANWTSPAPILASPEGQTNQPAMALDAEGRIYAAWRGGKAGEIFVSRADATRAAIASEWKAPVVLPSPNEGSSEPQIVIDANGRITIVYVIEVNDTRGVYVTHSADFGETWTTPTPIIKGVNVGWQRVTRPHLNLSESGRYHLMWHNETGPAGIGTLSMHYASSDDGEQWSALSVITDAPATWSKQLVRASHIVQVWQFDDEIWYRQSPDDGETWTRIEPVSRLTTPLTAFDVTLDGAGDLHVVQTVNSAELQHLRSQNGRWQILDRSLFESVEFNHTSPFALTFVTDSTLLSVQIGAAVEGNVVGTTPALLFTQRAFNIDATRGDQPFTTQAVPTIAAEDAAVEPIGTVAEALVAPTVETVPQFSTQRDQGMTVPVLGNLPTSRSFLLLLAIVPSLILIATIGAVVAIRMRRS